MSAPDRFGLEGRVMRANLDHPERFIRIVLGLVAGNLGFANPGFSWLAGTGPVQVAAVILGFFLLVTGLAGFCPLRFLVRRPGAR
jgi:hypothetical protein